MVNHCLKYHLWWLQTEAAGLLLLVEASHVARAVGLFQPSSSGRRAEVGVRADPRLSQEVREVCQVEGDSAN